jgi:hypothetical protein
MARSFVAQAHHAPPVLYFIAEFELVSALQTRRTCASHPPSSLDAAILRNRSHVPDKPKIALSCSPRSPARIADAHRRSDTGKSPSARKKSRVRTHLQRLEAGSTRAPGNMPPGIRADCNSTSVSRRRRSSADDPSGNGLSLAESSSSCSVTWTAPSAQYKTLSSRKARNSPARYVVVTPAAVARSLARQYLPRVALRIPLRRRARGVFLRPSILRCAQLSECHRALPFPCSSALLQRNQNPVVAATASLATTRK